MFAVRTHISPGLRDVGYRHCGQMCTSQCFKALRNFWRPMIVENTHSAVRHVVNVHRRHRVAAEAVRVLMESPVPLLGGTLLQMVLLPASALGIVVLIEPSIELAAGLLLVSACPGGALSNYYSHLGRLNVALSVMMTAVSSLLAFAVLSFILAIVFPLIASVQQTEIPAAQLVRQLFVILLLPIGVGMLIRKFFRVIVELHTSRLRALGLVLVVLLLGLILFDQWEGATRLFTDALVLAVLFTGIAVLAGSLEAF